MISYLLILSCYLGYIYAFKPLCSSCKFYTPHKLNKQLGLCELFKENGLNNIRLNNFASHCRNNENLCGKSGFLYESKNTQKDISDTSDTSDISDIIDQLDNMCCGEVNEKVEIEEYEKIEKELSNIFQQIKKHNTKKNYKTTKDLYKLFKKN